MIKRRRSVMIACVTFETVKISEPVEFYGANQVYLIHHVYDPSPDNVYQQFYDRTVELIAASVPKAEVHEVDCPVTDFIGLLREINGIVAREKGLQEEPEIRVNLSAGSPEFTAAAATASMMDPCLKAFFVRADGYTVPQDKVREVYYKDSKPVGLTSSVKGVDPMTEFSIKMPDENLVRALRLYQEHVTNVRLYSTEFISILKEAGLWNKKYGMIPRTPEQEKNNDKVYFQRAYVDKWKEQGWVARGANGYELTFKGKTAISVLYPEGE